MPGRVGGEGGGQTDKERGVCDSEISIVRGPLCVSFGGLFWGNGGRGGGSKKEGEDDRVGVLSRVLRQAGHCPSQCVAALVALRHYLGQWRDWGSGDQLNQKSN